MSAASFWSWALVGITVLWGWSFVAIHAALLEISASSFNAYRFLTGALVILLFVPKRIINMRRLDIAYGGIAGAALFFAFAFQTSGLRWTSASNASFITGLAIVFTPIFAYFILKSKPSKKQALGALIATVGLGLLTLKGISIHFGDLLVLACAVFTALHIVVLSKYSKGIDSAALAFVQVLVVGLLSLIWSLGENALDVPKTPAVFWAIGIIGVAGTALAYFVQTRAQVEASPSRIALILVLEPVFGGLFGYVLGGDRLGMVNIVGACLIVVGMVVTECEIDALSIKRFKSKANIKAN